MSQWSQARKADADAQQVLASQVQQWCNSLTVEQRTQLADWLMFNEAGFLRALACQVQLLDV